MANNKSALKRIQVTERNRLRNKTYKSAVKTLIKKYFTAVDTYARQPTPDALQEVENCLAAAYSKIDKAVKQGVLHDNNGARKKSGLARRLQQVDAKLKPASSDAAAS